jgi:hypothetical protein
MNARTATDVSFLVALGLSSILCSAAPAQPPAQARQERGNDVDRKLVTFEMRAKPWSEVFEWLADQSGVHVFTTDAKPTGTFTYIAPKNGVPQKKTISEVVDVLNAALRTKKFFLVRLTNAYALIPADEAPEPLFVQRIAKAADLEKHANSELVSLRNPLKVLNPEAFAPQLLRSMSTWGEVHVCSKENSLYLEDDVATLKQIVALIRNAETAACCRSIGPAR